MKEEFRKEILQEMKGTDLMESKTKKARNEEKEGDLNETPIHVGPIRPTQAKKEEFQLPTPKMTPRGSLSKGQGVWREEAKEVATVDEKEEAPEEPEEQEKDWWSSGSGWSWKSSTWGSWRDELKKKPTDNSKKNCKYWRLPAGCRKGEKCVFKHGPKEQPKEKDDDHNEPLPRSLTRQRSQE